MNDNNEPEIQNALQSLPEISEFVPRGPGAALVQQVAEYVAVVNEARDENQGLPQETVKTTEDSFLVDRVRNSATIEGANLDRRETLHVLTTGQIIEGKRRPSEEIRNLGDALKLVGELVHVDKIRETDIRTIHATLLKGLDENAGRYRPMDVRISNAKYRPPEHLDVPRLMFQFVENISSPTKEVDGFTLGVYAHWAMARIHPFVDGNGRMARIMQDLMFLRNRLVPAPVPYQDVDEYYSALEEADGGNAEPFVELIANYELATLRKYRTAIEENKQATNWLEQLISTANDAIRDTEHSLFTRHVQKMSEIRETFKSVSDKLSGSVPELRCKVREYSGIDFMQYREIKNTGRAARTWDFGVSFALRDREVRFIFWHGHHRRNPYDTITLDKSPVLIVSINEGDEYVTLNEANEQRVSLREIAIQDGQFVRVRYDPVKSVNEFDLPVTATEICRDFVTEVVKGKFNLT